MREVPRDDKWNNETDARMKGVQDDMNGSMDNLEAQLVSTGPSETELVIVSLLMRLYDINLAILNHLNESRADEIYEAHEKGEHFNPPIFVPEVNDANG